MSIIGIMINETVVGAYAREHRQVENQYHEEIMKIIENRLKNGEYDTVMRVIAVYRNETTKDRFYRNSLHRVIEQFKNAQPGNSPEPSAR
jgi:hypothetical protein